MYVNTGAAALGFKFDLRQYLLRCTALTRWRNAGLVFLWTLTPEMGVRLSKTYLGQLHTNTPGANLRSTAPHTILFR